MANPDERLGGGQTDAEEIKAHSWFAGVDWDMITNKQIKPPFKPKLQSSVDVRYIDEAFTKQRVGDSPESMVNSLQGGMWEGFTYEGKKGML